MKAQMLTYASRFNTLQKLVQKVYVCVKKFVPLHCVKRLCKNNQEACVRIDTKKTCEEVCDLALCGELV